MPLDFNNHGRSLADIEDVFCLQTHYSMLWLILMPWRAAPTDQHDHGHTVNLRQELSAFFRSPNN